MSFKEPKIYDKDAFLEDAKKIYGKNYKLVAEVSLRTKAKISPSLSWNSSGYEQVSVSFSEA